METCTESLERMLRATQQQSFKARFRQEHRKGRLGQALAWARM